MRNDDDLNARIRQAESTAIEAVETGRDVHQAQTELLLLYAERARRIGTVKPVQPKTLETDGYADDAEGRGEDVQ